MAGNYERSIYNQLMEVMVRLNTVERESRHEITQLNDEISSLKKENQLLRDDNARLKGIIDNDSSNTSLPPSTDQKGRKLANTYNGREKNGGKAGGQKGHKGTTLTKAEVEQKIKSGKCRHEIKTIGDASSGKYITKYVIDLSVAPLITEMRIYADEKNHFNISAEYRSDVTYGALAVSLYSEGVMSNDRITAFLNAAGNDELGLSEGSVYGFCKKLANAAGTSIRQLEDELLNQKVVAKYSHNHLLFMQDFAVPFDDNISERDLRKAKNRQKMASGFRKDSGHEMYCSILSIIETIKKRKMGMLENIRKLFMGTPAIF